MRRFVEELQVDSSILRPAAAMLSIYCASMWKTAQSCNGNLCGQLLASLLHTAILTRKATLGFAVRDACVLVGPDSLTCHCDYCAMSELTAEHHKAGQANGAFVVICGTDSSFDLLFQPACSLWQWLLTLGLCKSKILHAG